MTDEQIKMNGKLERRQTLYGNVCDAHDAERKMKTRRMKKSFVVVVVVVGTEIMLSIVC